ncbi:hypothetical protein KS4_02110 [Poriferisphaera corsica]|uniref:Uncharacterized protein n=1 Tax=Poriferisphaera corsica TaxID=2528020 RepID=A0A517YPP1_9BACT|nr:hypothetical protein KS4_02110 [Poriferisphaera corsica]
MIGPLERPTSLLTKPIHGWSQTTAQSEQPTQTDENFIINYLDDDGEFDEGTFYDDEEDDELYEDDEDDFFEDDEDDDEIFLEDDDEDDEEIFSDDDDDDDF